MEVAEIRDADSLRAWLETLPQETEAEREEAQRWAVAIAHRAAMRVLPVFWRVGTSEVAKRKGVNALSVLLCSLISELGHLGRPPPVARSSAWIYNAATLDPKIFDALSNTLALHDAFEVSFARDAVISISRSADTHLNALTSNDAAVIKSAIAAVQSAFEAGGAVEEKSSKGKAGFSVSFWLEIRADIIALANRKSLRLVPLWEANDQVSQHWCDAKLRILAQGEDWQFWVDWYENALHGRPQDYDLLTKIALIPPEDWDKGADHVNALIARIRAEHIAGTRPLGEDAIAQGADGLWRRVGRSVIDRDILQDAIDAVRDEIRTLRGKLQGPQGNMFTALVADLDLLDDRIARYPDRPLRLHDTFLRVQGHIAHNLDCGELPDDLAVRDLSATLGTAALDMHNACPKTKAVIEARMAARFADADEAAREDLRRLSEAAATLSDDELAEEFRTDAATATDPEAPETEKKPALYRLTTRLAVMVTRAGANILGALIIIGEIESGLTTLAAIYYAILRFFVGI